jgi:NAD(P)-dependent dehydrogenase (short-subunit alcohol dehydrogenase family)
MEIKGRSVLLLGGSGLVGMAVARKLAAHAPASVVVTGLTQPEAENAVTDLRAENVFTTQTQLAAEWGDIFLPQKLKDRTRPEVLDDVSARGDLIDDLYGELNEDVVNRSALGSLLLRHKPDIVIDTVNTATAFAYQNIFDLATSIRATAAAEGSVPAQDVERVLATLYFPQLIRHVQIALEGMRRAGTLFYIKIGTSGTGGMGLNIPFTHSEERPSRMLLAKSGVAGAHTLLLYLMARTPGAPAVKEIKPTAAISWKRITHGPITRRGKPITRIDATEALSLDAAFAPGANSHRDTGEPLSGVFLDAGENGLFSVGEFEALTALGLMEYVTPEEIADDVIREISGHPSGHDVIAALDSTTMGPTYRAGVLREVALERMNELEREHQIESVAYEMLGPPRLSKLLFEAAILARLYGDLGSLASSDPGATAQRAAGLIDNDADLRMRILSIGLPILRADGKLLRGAEVKVSPLPGQSPTDPKLVDNGWVDLREQNWRKWRDRATAMLQEIDGRVGPDQGSRFDTEPGSRRRQLRPGRMAAWIFRKEDRGERVKR